MITSTLIFCVACNNVLERGNAKLIFKTGFYKTSMPLGHCKECTYEGKEVDIDIASVSGQDYSDFSAGTSYFA